MYGKSKEARENKGDVSAIEFLWFDSRKVAVLLIWVESFYELKRKFRNFFSVPKFRIQIKETCLISFTLLTFFIPFPRNI